MQSSLGTTQASDVNETKVSRGTELKNSAFFTTDTGVKINKKRLAMLATRVDTLMGMGADQRAARLLANNDAQHNAKSQEFLNNIKRALKDAVPSEALPSLTSVGEVRPVVAAPRPASVPPPAVSTRFAQPNNPNRPKLPVRDKMTSETRLQAAVPAAKKVVQAPALPRLRSVPPPPLQAEETEAIQSRRTPVPAPSVPPALAAQVDPDKTPIWEPKKTGAAVRSLNFVRAPSQIASAGLRDMPVVAKRPSLPPPPNFNITPTRELSTPKASPNMGRLPDGAQLDKEMRARYASMTDKQYAKLKKTMDKEEARLLKPKTNWKEVGWNVTAGIMTAATGLAAGMVLILSGSLDRLQNMASGTDASKTTAALTTKAVEKAPQAAVAAPAPVAPAPVAVVAPSVPKATAAPAPVSKPFTAKAKAKPRVVAAPVVANDEAAPEAEAAPQPTHIRSDGIKSFGIPASEICEDETYACTRTGGTSPFKPKTRAIR